MDTTGSSLKNRHFGEINVAKHHHHRKRSSSSDSQLDKVLNPIQDSSSVWSSESSTLSNSTNSSLLEQLSLVRRTGKFHYQDAVRSATYSESDLVVNTLKWHNIMRSLHGTGPLSLSMELCHQAQFWANHLAHTETFHYEPDTFKGQNLLFKWSVDASTDPLAEEVVKYWYHFGDLYNFNLNESVLHTQASQFTQLIWKASSHFGLGAARSRGGKLIVVANYQPPGNVKNEFKQNVLPPLVTGVREHSRTSLVSDSYLAFVRSNLQKAKSVLFDKNMTLGVIGSNKSRM